MSQRYKVQHRYGANRDGRTYGPWQAGEVIELAADEAEWINRDSEDTLVQVDGETVAAPAEVVVEVVPDQAAIAAAVEDAVRQALTGAEQQRLAELDALQAQARAIVDDNAADPTSELAEQLRGLATEFVAGVGPAQAAELAVTVALGMTVAPALVVPGSTDTAAAPAVEATPAQPVEEKPAAEAKPKPPRRSGK